MLGEIEARVGSFVITAKPVSRLRSAFLDFLPYVQGQKVRFKVVVTALNDLSTDISLTYSIENTPNLLSHSHTIKQKPMRAGEKDSWVSEEIPLYRTGDSFLVFWESGNSGARQDAFLFHTTSKNTIFLTIAGIVVTAAAAIIAIG